MGATEQPFDRALQQQRVEAIIRFAELQKQLLTKPPTFTSTIVKHNYGLADRFMDVEKEQGEPVYTNLSNEYILELQGAIDICGVSVCAVHEKTMEQGAAAGLFELIVRDTCAARILVGCKPLLDSMPTAPRNPDNDMDVVDPMPYSQAMEAFDHVVRSSKLTASKVLGVARCPPDGEDVTDGVVVRCEVGLFLKMTCAIKDVVASAAMVHNN